MPLAKKDTVHNLPETMVWPYRTIDIPALLSPFLTILCRWSMFFCCYCQPGHWSKYISFSSRLLQRFWVQLRSERGKSSGTQNFTPTKKLMSCRNANEILKSKYFQKIDILRRKSIIFLEFVQRAKAKTLVNTRENDCMKHARLLGSFRNSRRFTISASLGEQMFKVIFPNQVTIW